MNAAGSSENYSKLARVEVPSAPLMRQSEKCPEAPEGCCAEKDHESYTGEPTRSWSFAPRLEHGNHSNKGSKDGGCAEDLKPHGSTLPRAQRDEHSRSRATLRRINARAVTVRAQ